MRFAEMLHGVVGKGRPQTLRLVTTFIFIFMPSSPIVTRDVADKDFITAFREEQGAQYSNLEGARSIDFGYFGQVVLEIYSKFLSHQSVIFWYDSW